MFEKGPTSDSFVLIVYDTKRVAEIDECDHYEGYEKDYPPLAAKYALLTANSVSGDSHIFAQELRHRTYRNDAVWFDTWDNIDFAMTELRQRNPTVNLTDKIGTVIDWPWSERTDDPIHLKVGDYRTRHPKWRLEATRNK